MNGERPLVLVSNRGPATFERNEAGDLVASRGGGGLAPAPATFERTEAGALVASRGGGGLVTALTGLVEHREAVWVASAMGPADVEVSRSHGGGAVDCEGDDTAHPGRP